MKEVKKRRPRICKHCGEAFTPRGQEICCPACRLLAWQDSRIRTRTCADCGRTFDGAPRQKRCPECQAERRREQGRAHHRLGPRRPLGSTDRCQRCGRPYVVKSGAQRFCPECGETARKEEASRKKAAKLRGKPHADRTMIHICAVCGRHFRGTDAATTCSPDCHATLRRVRMAIIDEKRRPTQNPRRKKMLTQTEIGMALVATRATYDPELRAKVLARTARRLMEDLDRAIADGDVQGEGDGERFLWHHPSGETVEIRDDPSGDDGFVLSVGDDARGRFRSFAEVRDDRLGLAIERLIGDLWE